MRYTYDEPFIVGNEVQINRDYFKSKVGLFNKVSLLLRRRTKKKDYIILNAFSGKRYKPKKRNGYDRNMIILVNEGSFSAACTYALYAKSNERAILVGEETGGSYHIVSAGSSYDCTLKNSKLSVRIPVMKFDYNVDVNRQSELNGIIPHIPVANSVADHLKGIDRQMETAVNLIRMHRNKDKN